MNTHTKFLTRTPANNIYVARQPIFDRASRVFGYELLYRSENMDNAVFIDGRVATAELVINSFIELGIEEITNGKQAFINLTREFITGEIPIPLEPKSIVLEILEDITADPECIKGTQQLSKRGFTIALDDFEINDSNKGLIPYAHIIKVDIMAFSGPALVKEVEKLKQYSVKLLAEKVETREEYEHCLELGFHYFQGYFFSKPAIIEGKKLQANKLKLLEIIAKLEADSNISEIEEIIIQDVAISFKLLKIINSSYYSFARQVDSVQHALVLLGLEALKNWITLICFSMVENKPDELIAMSLIRAKMSESLAEHCGCSRASAFTAGLFSMLDVLMDQPLQELLDQVPLEEDIKAALTIRKGPLGILLNAVENYEKGDCSDMDQLGLKGINVNSIYLESVAEANKLTNLNI